MIPIIDISSALTWSSEERDDITAIAKEIDKACREVGFFMITGHGIEDELILELEKKSREFFDQSFEKKQEISMSKGKSSWRGYFGLGTELTSGKSDGKEGIYFGKHHDQSHPLVVSSTPSFGSNLFPKTPELRHSVESYMEQAENLSRLLVSKVFIYI